MAKILVAMSGGIDSAVVAHKLKLQGHHIEGVYMKLHSNENYHKENIDKLQEVCIYLGIKYHILDLQDKFDKQVYSYFINSYKDGLTPNPCVVCNKNIKFGELVEFSKKLGFEKLATGHYVDIKDGFFSEAYDNSKDQSYFLANVDPEITSYLIFPLGKILKNDIKEYASSIEILKSFVKQKESSEICFVDDTYIDILKNHFSVDKDGVVVDKNGKNIGSHKGYMHYTVGKRRGFNVRVAHKPHYVTNIDAKNNIVEVGLKDDLKKESFEVEKLSLYVNVENINTKVKIRYRSKKVDCSISLLGNNRALVTLFTPVYGIAPGQFAVFYDNDKVIGCGVIK